MMAPVKLTRELLFPRRCPICDRPVSPPGELACFSCQDTVRPIAAPYCVRCGKPLSQNDPEYCSDCRKRPHVFRQGCAVYPYRDVSGAIYRFKFENRAEYADWFGREMAIRIRDRFGRDRIDLLIPVPSSAERVRERGYNQAELLCRAVSRESGILLRTDVLERVTNTPYLRGMDAAGRREKLKNAFLVYGNDVESKRIMLIDDIYTTGSTMDACASQLYHAGASDVLFCTLAIGNPGGAKSRKSGREPGTI